MDENSSSDSGNQTNQDMSHVIPSNPPPPSNTIITFENPSMLTQKSTLQIIFKQLALRGYDMAAFFESYYKQFGPQIFGEETTGIMVFELQKFIDLFKVQNQPLPKEDNYLTNTEMMAILTENFKEYKNKTISNLKDKKGYDKSLLIKIESDLVQDLDDQIKKQKEKEEKQSSSSIIPQDKNEEYKYKVDETVIIEEISAQKNYDKEKVECLNFLQKLENTQNGAKNELNLVVKVVG